MRDRCSGSGRGYGRAEASRQVGRIYWIAGRFHRMVDSSVTSQWPRVEIVNFSWFGVERKPASSENDKGSECREREAEETRPLA